MILQSVTRHPRIQLTGSWRIRHAGHPSFALTWSYKLLHGTDVSDPYLIKSRSGSKTLRRTAKIRIQRILMLRRASLISNMCSPDPIICYAAAWSLADGGRLLQYWAGRGEGVDEDLASVAAHTTWLFALCYARITIRVAEPKTSYSPYKMMLNRLQPTGTVGTKQRQFKIYYIYSWCQSWSRILGTV